MVKPSLPLFFVFRTNVVPDIDGNDGRLMIFVNDDRKTVI